VNPVWSARLVGISGQRNARPRQQPADFIELFELPIADANFATLAVDVTNIDIEAERALQVEFERLGVHILVVGHRFAFAARAAARFGRGLVAFGKRFRVANRKALRDDGESEGCWILGLQKCAGVASRQAPFPDMLALSRRSVFETCSRLLPTWVATDSCVRPKRSMRDL